MRRICILACVAILIWPFLKADDNTIDIVIKDNGDKEKPDKRNRAPAKNAPEINATFSDEDCRLRVWSPTDPAMEVDLTVTDGAGYEVYTSSIIDVDVVLPRSESGYTLTIVSTTWSAVGYFN